MSDGTAPDWVAGKLRIVNRQGIDTMRDEVSRNGWKTVPVAAGAGIPYEVFKMLLTGVRECDIISSTM